MPSLQTAVTFAKIYDVLTVTDDLNFNVSWVGHELFAVEAVVAERGPGFRLTSCVCIRDLLSKGDHSHTTTPTTVECFYNNGAMIRHRKVESLYIFQARGAVCALEHRHIGIDCFVTGKGLVAEERECVSRRSDKFNACCSQCAGQIGILGKKTVTWVNGRAFGLSCGIDDGLYIEVSRRAMA